MKVASLLTKEKVDRFFKDAEDEPYLLVWKGSLFTQFAGFRDDAIKAQPSTITLKPQIQLGVN